MTHIPFIERARIIISNIHSITVSLMNQVPLLILATILSYHLDLYSDLVTQPDHFFQMHQ